MKKEEYIKRYGEAEWEKMEHKGVYTQEEKDKAAVEIGKTARRFHTTEEDVIFAAWIIARDVVWAKLERIIKGGEKEK